LKFALAALILLLTLQVFAQFQVPRLQGPVMDQAGIISSGTEARLSKALLYLRKNGGSQIQILTIKSLAGESIEQASIQIVDQWELGEKGKDNGVLLLIADKEKKLRIEVGQGLEGDLPDALAKRIISEVMIPLFKSGDKSTGVMLGALNIAQRTDPKVDLGSFFSGSRNNYKSQKTVSKKKSLASKVFSFLTMLFFIILFIKNPFLALMLLSGGRSGGRGMGGGGGWSGGGGGFSGGGASGDW
jgi:uncharacterized protein